MKKYVLDIRFGAEAKIDIDHAPDVTTEEFEKVLDELRKIMDTILPEFRFRAVDRLYVADISGRLVKELNNIGKVVRAEQIEEFRVCFAFMA